MEELHRQIRRAARRLLWNRLLHHVTWSLLAALLIALLAIAVRKLFPLEVAGRTWALAWAAGSVAAGLLAAGVWTYVGRQTELDAAIEIDLRFGLKERVSSAWALSPGERETEFGRALVDDARRRVQRIDVAERFHPEWSWHPALPLVVALAVFLVAFFVPDATRDRAAASVADAAAKAQVRKSLQELKKRLADRQQKALTTGLEEADQLTVKLEQAVSDLAKSDVDRKKALVKLNNLSKKIADKRTELGSSEKVRDQLKQLKDIPNGPADKIASALQNGDMQRAMEELQQLRDKLRGDELTPLEKEQLANQVRQLGKEVEKLLAERQALQDKQRELQDRVNDLQRSGDLAGAGQLQQKLDQLQQQLNNLDQQNPALPRLQALASQLQDCADAVQAGNGKQAADQLDQLASDLQQLRDEMQNLQDLDAVMQEIANAKSAMNCEKCGGEGCENCLDAGNIMAQFSGDQFSEIPGRGLGPGHGMGARPIEATETGGYRTRVAADPRAGEAVRVGDAQGPNVAGHSSADVMQTIASETSQDPDPVAQQELPRREREQTKEYFESLRKGL